MQIDKYHAVMGEGALKVKDFDKHLNSLYHTQARFYVTQRKLNYAPVLGHERLAYDLAHNFPDHQERRFMLHSDIENFQNELMSEVDREGIGRVRTVRPGTIMFANQPIADIEGCFGMVQSQEISFEHAFDLPMTVASNAIHLKKAAGKNKVMDFSLRRNGDLYRANDVTKFAYIGGFEQTSSLTGAMATGAEWVGTVAHYWQQAFVNKGTSSKHWEQVAFEAWLDANQDGTTLLLDTISTNVGMVHAAAAALSNPTRMNAFKSFRIDSGDVTESCVEVLRYFESQGIKVENLTAILTGDMDVLSIETAARLIGFHYPKVKLIFGVGTKLAAESKVAGVIFKLSEIDGQPTLKCSNPEKATLPGKLQVYRIMNVKTGFYVKDIVSLDRSVTRDLETKNENYSPEVVEALNQETIALSLLQDFNTGFQPMNESLSGIRTLKSFVKESIRRFEDIDNYPVIYTKELTDLKTKLIHEFRGENV